jgi:excisionase family DNA binding protein
LSKKSAADLEKISATVAAGRFEELPNPLLTEEAAVVARRSVPTMKRLCQNGTVRAVKFGGIWNINRDALLRYAGLTQ